DVQRAQQEMASFLQGVAQYLNAVGPMVQQGAMPQDVAIEVFSSFARHFNLGKQAEDTLEKWADETRNNAQGGSPSPQQQAEQAKVQAEQAKLKLESDKLQLEAQVKLKELE